PTGAQSIYYARNIVGAAANTVRVDFGAPAATPDVRILEYRGLDATSPLDAVAAATGNGTTSTNAVATTQPNDLLVAANYVDTHTTGPGTGFTSRLVTGDGNIVEDQVATEAGSYSANALLAPPKRNGGNGWVMQTAAFKAAGAASPGFVQGTNRTSALS